MQKIGFISDIHFGELARSNEFTLPGQDAKGDTKGAASLSEGLARILKDNGVQYLFVGGDLTSRARPQEFFYCEKRILYIAQQAGIPRENIIWGIGNHDVDWRITKIADQYSTENQEVYDVAKNAYRLIAANVAFHNLDELPKLQEAGPVPLSGIVSNEDFIVFVLNSGLYCTHDQQYSHGKLSEEQLKWFETMGKKYKNEDKWKIVLLHHHPHNYSYHIPGVDISTLEEGSNFADIAGSVGIDLVLHGHRHHPRAETDNKTQWDKAITFICGGSLSVNAEHRSNGDIPNTFHIIELTDDIGKLILRNYEYSAGEGWKPFSKNTPETPLEAEMKLGKVLSEKDAKQVISDMSNFEGNSHSLKWCDFSDDLHYWGYTKTNKLVQEILSPQFDVFGEFPKDVMLIRKEEMT